MCKSIKPEPTVDEHLAFRWWTYGALILYTASLLVLCGYVTSQKYSLADGLPTPSATAKTAARTLAKPEILTQARVCRHGADPAPQKPLAENSSHL